LNPTEVQTIAKQANFFQDDLHTIISHNSFLFPTSALPQSWYGPSLDPVGRLISILSSDPNQPVTCAVYQHIDSLTHAFRNVEQTGTTLVEWMAHDSWFLLCLLVVTYWWVIFFQQSNAAFTKKRIEYSRPLPVW
jgi:hypothetical protein